MFFLANCSKGGTHVVDPRGKNFRINFRCAWKGRGPELLAPIASNKNMQESNKKLEVMTWVTKAQLPRYVVEAMISKEINPMPPLKNSPHGGIKNGKLTLKTWKGGGNNKAKKESF